MIYRSLLQSCKCLFAIYVLVLNKLLLFQFASSSLTLVWSFPKPVAEPQQVSDLVDRLIRNRNPGAVFTTTERADVTWQTLRSITYSPTLHQGAVGSASVQEASLVRRWVVMALLLLYPVFIFQFQEPGLQVWEQ